MSKKSFNRALTIIIIALSLVGSYFLGYFSFKWKLSDTEKTVLRILEAYEDYYYFKDENLVDIISDAIFDDYSTYYTPEEYEEVVNKALGENANFGLKFVSETLQIHSVIVNSPCFKSGVTAGGTLVSVTYNGVETFGKEGKLMMQELSVGQEVTIKIDYSGTEKSFTITKEEYNESYVTYIGSTGSYYFTDKTSGMQLEKYSNESLSASGVGYIKFSSFNGRSVNDYGSASQMRKVLLKFKEEGNTKLILDLRGNLGGYMDVASLISGMLVEPKQDKQVYSITINRDGKEKHHTFSKDSVIDYSWFEKIIVLADVNTASASEVLIGAMLDYDDKNIVSVIIEGHTEGDQIVYRSRGKGIMQTTYKYNDGSAIKLTTSRVFWPKSRICIHGVGITTNTSAKVHNAVGMDALSYALNIL